MEARCSQYVHEQMQTISIICYDYLSQENAVFLCVEIFLCISQAF